MSGGAIGVERVSDEISSARGSVAPVRRFKPYPAYRDSGVGWLGEIPEHWGLRRLKRIGRLQGGGTPTKDTGDYWGGDVLWVSPKDMKVPVVADTEDKITSRAIRESAASLVPAGAVLLVVRSGILVHSIPVALAGRELTVNQDLKAILPRSEVRSEYLCYLVRGLQRELLIEWKKEGATVESLDVGLIQQTPLPLPTEAEQRAIAAFLDRETAKIDALVAKEERLVELLQEKRAALITHAVTKGLDPNAPTKDSGVEWLGEIPERWEVRAVWTAFSLGRGRVISHEEIFEHQGPYPVYSSQTDTDGIMGFLDSYDFDGEYLTWTTDGAKAGTVFRRSGKFNCTNVCGTLHERGQGKVDLGFCRDALNLATARFVRHDINPKLMNNVMARLRIPAPPAEEQQTIARFAHQQTASADSLVGKICGGIDRLRELRTALISAAVTGKIDVRGEVA